MGAYPPRRCGISYTCANRMDTLNHSWYIAGNGGGAWGLPDLGRAAMQFLSSQ